MNKILCKIKKIWAPVLVEEGAMCPKGYGYSRWLPYDRQFREPDPSGGVYYWRKVAHPIPVNVLISAYWYTWHLLKRGYALPPQFYRNRLFEVKTNCPHCHKDIYEFPIPHD